MKFCFFSFSIFFSIFFSQVFFAQIPDDLIIEGDEFFYRNNQQVFLVSGNASLSYLDYDIRARQLDFNYKNETIHIPYEFMIDRGSLMIDGKNMFYDFLKNKGRIDHLKLSSDRMFISGDNVKLYKEKILIENAYFTTCSAEAICEKNKPDYFIKSKRIEIFPPLGLLLSKSNQIKIKNVPFYIPIPFYVYGSNELSVTNSHFIPSFGSNELEGNYIKQSINYYANSKFMSALDLYYSQNLGGGLGGTHLYFPVNRLRTKFHYLYFGRKKPVHGNFVVQYLSKKDSFLENYDIFQVLKNNPSNFIKSRNPSSIFFTLSRRQNINNKFVSQLPEFKYDSSEFYLNESLKSRYNYGFTKLLEEDSNYQQKGDKIFLNFTTKYNKKISKNLDFFSDGFFDGAYYFNQDQWVRLFQSLGIQYDIFLKPKIAYNKKILGFGRSPFLHENVYSLQSDEIEFHLEHQFKRYQLKNSSFFDLNKAEFRESKIELNLIKSCWVFGFGANLIQESIYFNFQLN